MFNKLLTTAFILFFSMNIYAYACTSPDDCKDWKHQHCSCGVEAICQGLTATAPGNCQCFGAEGKCSGSKGHGDDEDTSQAADKHALPAAVRN